MGWSTKIWKQNRAKIREILLNFFLLKQYHVNSLRERNSPSIVMTCNLRNFWYVPFIRNFTLMTSSKWKMVIIKLIENYFSYNISKFGHEIDQTDIDLDHDKHEWEIPFGYEDMIMSKFSENFTKWRLDDVICQGQGWKPYCVMSICLYICVLNFKAFEWTITKLSC